MNNPARCLWLLFLVAAGPLWADDMRPASLNITAQDAGTFEVVWKVPQKDDRRPAIDVVFGEDVRALPAISRQVLPAAYLEKWTIERAAGLGGMYVSVAGLPENAVDVLLRVTDADGSTMTAVLNADRQSFTVPAAIKTGNVASTYTVLGVEHILSGFDHLLFVACLIYICRTRRQLLLTITGFTVAHSITLIMAATGFANVPVAPVEAVIALSIILLAREIAGNRETSVSLRFPVLVSAGFGLVHGFGFASVLAEIGLPANEKLTALLFFNVGVEIGQLLFVLALFVAFYLLRRVFATFTMETLRFPVSYFCGSVATFWLFTRIAVF